MLYTRNDTYAACILAALRHPGTDVASIDNDRSHAGLHIRLGVDCRTVGNTLDLHLDSMRNVSSLARRIFKN